MRAFLGPAAIATQLEPGSFEAVLTSVSIGPVRLAYLKSNRKGTAAGARLPGARSFGLPMMDHAEALWCGRRVSAGAVTGYDPSGEVEAVVPAGFESVVFAMENGFEKDLGPAPDPIRNSGKQVLRGSLSRVTQLRSRLLRTISWVREQPSLIENVDFRNDLECTIVDSLTEISSQGAITIAPLDGKLKHRLVETALDRIASSPNDPLAVEDLCAGSGASVWTLRRAFRDRFGVSPKRFLLLRRLGAVRSDLLGADPEVAKINSIAGRWGFWHMGQFAADYRRMFGELPSKTLKDGARLRARVTIPSAETL